MFNGIVEIAGTIQDIIEMKGCKTFILYSPLDFTDIEIGHSIAVNGACLTVTDFSAHTLHVTVVPETLRLTNLNTLKKGDLVNLERAMQANARIGGHYVQGHVDSTGKILELVADNSDAWLVKISLASTLKKYVVKKGYIAVDGMSLTIVEVQSDYFIVTLIPHTQAVTIAKQYAVGRVLNIEVDMMGKYIESLLGAYAHDTV